MRVIGDWEPHARRYADHPLVIDTNLLLLLIVVLGFGCLWAYCEIDRPGEMRTHITVAAFVGMFYGFPAGAFVGAVVGIIVLRNKTPRPPK